jgi:sec-independent protein translocase protein TatC
MRENRDEVREPLLQHIRELFVSIRLTVMWVVAGAAIGYVGSEYVVNWIQEPFRRVMGQEAKLVYLSPFEKIWVHLRVALWSGLLVVAPGIYCAIYHFVKPALLKRERRNLNTMLGVALVVFWVGIFFAQRYTVPLLLKAVMSFKSLNEAPFLALSPYVDMTLGALIATALLFELPVMMFFLSLLGWVSSRRWASSRRVAIVTNAAVSAVLSPPDVMSMLIMMVPIHLLYELGILVSRVAEWKKHEPSPKHS